MIKNQIDWAFTLIEAKRMASNGTFTGLASSWGFDRDGDQMLPGAFTKSLADYQARDSRVPLLLYHDTNRPIGSIASIKETSEGLYVSGEIAIDTDDGALAYALLKKRALSMSVGFFPDQEKTIKGTVGNNIYQQVDLVEISLVPVAANPDAVVQTVKYLSRGDLEHAAREKLQLSRNQAKALAALYWPAYSKTEAESDEPKPEQLAALAAQMKKFTKIYK